jgi:hypothetical protein
MRRGDARAALTVLRLQKRFGDVKLSEVWDRLMLERNRRRGRPQKWDDDIAGQVYLLVRAVMARGFKKTDSQKKLAQYKHPKGPKGWFTFSEVVTCFKRGEEYLGKLTDAEAAEMVKPWFEGMPSLKAYIDGLG